MEITRAKADDRHLERIGEVLRSTRTHRQACHSGEESLQDAVHGASASAGIAAGQRPRPSIRHAQGEVIAERYVMFLCNRLDSAHPSASVPLFEPGRRYKKSSGESRIVMSHEAIGNKHAWHDPQLHGPYLSDALANEMRQLRLTGAGSFEFDEA